MAAITLFSCYQILPWRLLIGTLLLLCFAISQKPRAGVVTVTAFVGPGRTASGRGFKSVDSESYNGCKRLTMMRSSIVSRRYAAFSTSRRRFRSSPFLPSSSLLECNSESRRTQIGALPSNYHGSYFSSSGTRSTAAITSTKVRNRLFSSNVPPLHSTATAVEEPSNTTTTATVEIATETKKKKSMFFADQAPISSSATTIVDDNNDGADLFHGLKSRPVEGGNWNPSASLIWTKDFGRRCPDYEKRCQEQESFTRLKPGDEGYFDVQI